MFRCELPLLLQLVPLMLGDEKINVEKNWRNKDILKEGGVGYYRAAFGSVTTARTMVSQLPVVVDVTNQLEKSITRP